MMTMKHRPLLLTILDGFGYSHAQEGNAIARAHMPFWTEACKRGAYTLIAASGRRVGLPEGQMGNSEVGHLNIGAGRVVDQDITRINQAIDEGTFAKNDVLLNLIQDAISRDKALHVLGLLSPGGVHSHEEHIYALIALAAQQGLKKLYLHAFLDGRDTPPRSALTSIQSLEAVCEKYRCGKIVTIIGRYYAMDRDQRWERIQQAYDLLTLGATDVVAHTATQALAMAYERGESDEFVRGTLIHAMDEPVVTIDIGDNILFMNYRADRARQLTDAFIAADFDKFTRKKNLVRNHFVTLTQYDALFPCPVVFPSIKLTNMLGEYLSSLNLRQFRIAETEKYAHVTFFFNGGVETPFPGEKRLLIPSPKIATYDLQPDMSAALLTEELIDAICMKQPDFIVCNFANPDMVGHTGNFAATVKALEKVDVCLSKIYAALQFVGGEMIITADHGNAEKMFDHATGQAHTAHTTEPVPFLYLGRPATIHSTNGALADVAPTVLYIMGLNKPAEMTGNSLLRFYENMS